MCQDIGERCIVIRDFSILLRVQFEFWIGPPLDENSSGKFDLCVSLVNFVRSFSCLGSPLNEKSWYAMLLRSCGILESYVVIAIFVRKKRRFSSDVGFSFDTSTLSHLPCANAFNYACCIILLWVTISVRTTSFSIVELTPVRDNNVPQRDD